MDPQERTQAQPASTGVTSTSRSLLASVTEHDEVAWQRLVQLYTPMVYHWCRQYDLPEQDMADVFQEVFQSVSRKIIDFRRDRPGDTFRGWLRIITRNKVYDHFRRSGRQTHGAGGTDANVRIAQLPDPFDDDDDDPPEDDHDARRELFHRALAQIREHFEPRTWQAFWRVVVDGLTPADVAEELAMRPGTVRVAKSRVLHRLRTELGDLLD